MTNDDESKIWLHDLPEQPDVQRDVSGDDRGDRADRRGKQVHL